MKLSSKFAFFFLAPALVTPINAAIIANDFFNGYGVVEVNTNGLSGGSGDWTSNWSGSDATYAPGSSISFGAAGYDNSANLSGSGDGALTGTTNTTGFPTSSFRTFNDGGAATIWFSALISMDGSDRAVLWIDATGATPNDFVGILDGQITLRHDGTTIGTNGLYGSNANPNGNATFTSGTALLLAKADINYSGSNDALTFWFNPDVSAGEGGLGAPTLTAPLGLDIFGNEIGGVGVLIAGTNGGNEYLDAVRVGTAFVDVVPEPSSMGLLGLTGACLLLRRKRI